MSLGIFSKLTTIEDKAGQIVASAEKEKNLALLMAKKQADELIDQARKTAKDEAAAIIEEAKLSGHKEKEALEAETGRLLEELRHGIDSKFETAKKHVVS